MDEIRASLRRGAGEVLPQGATGYHRWDIKWTYSYARAEVYCELRDIAIEINSTITLPQWQRPDDADPALVAAWDQYLVDLGRHEDGHRVLTYRSASQIRRALGRLRVEDCAFIVNEARKIGEEILARHRQESAGFDADPVNRVTWPPLAAFGPSGNSLLALENPRWVQKEDPAGRNPTGHEGHRQ